MTKEEKIKEAYGASWQDLELVGQKCALKNNGWIASIIDHAPRGIDLEYEKMTFRPKSLAGIENNNGWVKIYRKSDMPTFDCDCFVIDKNEGIITALWIQHSNTEKDEEARDFWFNNATHYQIIKRPEMPLY